MPSVIATLKRRRTSLVLAAKNPLPAIRYATRLIRNALGQFDAVEIHGVRQFANPSNPPETCCEVDDDNPSFFSVYLHCVSGGVACCADLPTHRKALRYAKAIARRCRWPVYDCYPQRDNDTRPAP
ncbi:hypothetical protein [Burkholderia sp. Ed8]|uniref:hypothetical protein n=1 Tax=Burkholderia sp. Ed8 TaxID=3112957 RepID=UPI00345D1121